MAVSDHLAVVLLAKILRLINDPSKYACLYKTNFTRINCNIEDS